MIDPLKRKVLIIENDQEIRNIISYILEDAGFMTSSIPEPDSLAQAARFNPHVILIDEFVNSKPGHRLCVEIKQVKELLHVPVIVLSTANNIEQIATDCQANDYIRKPFDVAELVSKVVHVLDSQSLVY
jgi:two-component system phosphate regulon response regulator PhoB